MTNGTWVMGKCIPTNDPEWGYGFIQTEQSTLYYDDSKCETSTFDVPHTGGAKCHTNGHFYFRNIVG